jgi:hypothetical protein
VIEAIGANAACPCSSSVAWVPYFVFLFSSSSNGSVFEF